MTAALIIAGTYAVLAFGCLPFLRIDRTGAAMVGAILMVVTGVVPLDAAYQAIDYRTLVLLFGMMILIASLMLARFFRTVARAVVTHVAHPALLLAAIVFTTGTLSALVAAAAAGALLVSRTVNPAKFYGGVDWDLLTLFVGLFVVIAGVERAGLDRRFFELLQPFGIATTAGLAAVGAILSNLISNVPAVMLFTRLVPHLPDPRQSWLVLAMATTLAGNLTVLGSIANLIVIAGARKRGVRISFVDHLNVGLPVTVATLAFGVWWLR